MTDETINRDQIIDFIKAGIQAPSPDNLQPWRFKLIPNGFELHLDRKYMGHFFDDRDIATRMSCGALIENVTLCAQNAGYGIDSDYSTEEKDCLVKIQFTPGTVEKTDDISHTVFTRCTNRHFFKPGRTISNDEIIQLNKLVNTDAFHLHWYQEPRQRGQAIRIVTTADTIRFSHEPVHNDFYDVLRFGKTGQQRRDGLAEQTLGIESFFIPVLKLLRPWKLTRNLNRLGLHHVMALRGTRLPMMSAPHIVSIVHSGEPDDLASGRMMQRFWLKLTDLGISTQPLGAFPLFLSRLHQSFGEGFTQEQIDKLQQIDRQLMAITPDYDPATDQLVMMFRLGYSSTPPHRAYRRPVETFLF